LAHYIHHLRFHNEVVFMLQHPPGNHSANVQFRRGSERVHAHSSVTKHHPARHYADLPQFRQTVDDRLGDPFAQIIVRRIAAGVFEWHYCQRIDGFFGVRFPTSWFSGGWHGRST
jgi:hypothetical protein